MIIFTDGSSKKSNQVVISGIVCINENEIIKEVFYCYKETLNYNYNESIHEFVAILKAIEFIEEQKIDDTILIINDSVQVIKLFNELKDGNKTHLKFIKNNLIKESLENIKLDQYIFIQLPRTTLGINVADFLNRETEKFTNQFDSHYLGTQMRKLKRNRFDFNISSKSKKQKF